MSEPKGLATQDAWLEPRNITAMTERNPEGVCNRDLTANGLGNHGRFEASALQLWERLVARRRLSTRSGIRLLRVARTVADLNDTDHVNVDAVAEASGFRCADLLQLESTT